MGFLSDFMQARAVRTNPAYAAQEKAASERAIALEDRAASQGRLKELMGQRGGVSQVAPQVQQQAQQQTELPSIGGAGSQQPAYQKKAASGIFGTPDQQKEAYFKMMSDPLKDVRALGAGIFGRDMNNIATAQRNDANNIATGERNTATIAGREAAAIAARKAQLLSPETYGLSPTYVTNAKGEQELIQLGNRGGVKQVGLPKGYSASSKLVKTNVGDKTIWTHPITGEVVKEIDNTLAPDQTVKHARDIVEAKTDQKMTTEDLSKKRIGYTKYNRGSEDMLRIIDQMIGTEDGTLKEHPGLASAIGVESVFPSWPGGNSSNFETLQEQLTGKAFMEVFQELKGAGPITDVEGEKATGAFSRMKSASSDEEFRKAANELRRHIRQMLQDRRGELGLDPNGEMPNYEGDRDTQMLPKGMQGVPVTLDGVQYIQTENGWEQQ